jgi:acetyltransferase-like isoleucine patch superfamily enzyme
MNQLYSKLGNLIRNCYLRIRYPFIKHGNEFHFNLSCKISRRVDSIACGNSVGIGPDNIFMCNVLFGNNIMTGPEVKFLNKIEHVYNTVGKDIFHSGWGEMSQIVIKDEVWIGCSSIILGPCTIGQGSILAAGSIVTKDIPPYSIVGGNPARLIKMRFTNEEIIEHESRLIKNKER